jgi:ppGpp synthetase/RelA/SpoT-type nucleotidyltranferase
MKEIEMLVAFFVANQGPYRRFVSALHGQISDAINPENKHELSGLVHSVKFRLKSPEHLRDKLVRKHHECDREGRAFPYTAANLFSKVGDLAGYRILHLHTRQFERLNAHLIPILEESHKIVEGPIAKVWDQETKEYFESIGVETEENKRMYSSVHYLVQPNSKTTLTIELQVRTLADEIWGEIDHKINYPHPHDLLACREQIRALARLTSSCSRLVDSVMATHADWERVISKVEGGET